MASPILLLIPGQLPVTNLTATSPTQLVADVPCLAPQLCISLVPQHCAGVLGPNDGIGVYVTDFQMDAETAERMQLAGGGGGGMGSTAALSFENYHFLGYVSLAKPSIQPRLPSTMCLTSNARFGFTLENVASLQNIATPTAKVAVSAASSSFPTAPATVMNAYSQQQQQQWGDYGFNSSYQQQASYPAHYGGGGGVPRNTKSLAAEQNHSAVRIGKAIVSHLHTFLTSFAKNFSDGSGCDAQNREAIYLPADWEARWFAKFIAKRDSGAYSGEEDGGRI